MTAAAAVAIRIASARRRRILCEADSKKATNFRSWLFACPLPISRDRQMSNVSQQGPPEANSVWASRECLVACARSRSSSRSSSSCVRSGSTSVRSSGSSRSTSIARSSSSARSSSRSVRSSSSRCRSSGCVASRRSSLVAALVARSQCNSCQQGCYEEGFLHDHVLLWLKVSNSAK
jgi:hypothetical protein